MYTVDEVIGTWKTIKFSGALPADRVAVLLERVEVLQRGRVRPRAGQHAESDRPARRRRPYRVPAGRVATSAS